ncbi:4Fe-4S dicluster domain-containing protein [Desulfitobacterium chlororespirans]|uniref:4Fe-4S binding domain-containing protein n=1 Tax=Desulfitobacterium chlororespirans DSM 11544 TaxID=1121395 RepID=A0A1M7RY66_9FIRM|nr:4Fe-4S dicluster domain-containing protein [Desulfitobacterium chlororespirans]SHN51269.1 4Fe-4S binding domain-containing protein [Desulfitobacterium chlororespirans DSM 11544]
MSVGRINFTPEKCIQCYSCETSCKIWREVEQGISWRKIKLEWQGAYPEVKSRPVDTACRHCSEPACLAACPAGAIEKEEVHGIVYVREDACIGCQACLSACPYDIPQFGKSGTMQKCDLCYGLKDRVSTPVCVSNCPTQALQVQEV